MMAFPVHEKKHLSSGTRVEGTDTRIRAACGPVAPDGSSGTEYVSPDFFSCGPAASKQPFQFNSIPHDAVRGNTTSKIRGLLVHLKIFDSEICELVQLLGGSWVNTDPLSPMALAGLIYVLPNRLHISEGTSLLGYFHSKLVSSTKILTCHRVISDNESHHQQQLQQINQNTLYSIPKLCPYN